MLFIQARRKVGLAFSAAAILALAPAAAGAQETIPATLQDAMRVEISFLTMDRMMARCAAEAGNAAAYEEAGLEWLARNAYSRHLAGVTTAFLGHQTDMAALELRADQDTDAIFNPPTPPSEICPAFLEAIPAGTMDITALVPDVYDRLVESDRLITEAKR